MSDTTARHRPNITARGVHLLGWAAMPLAIAACSSAPTSHPPSTAPDSDADATAVPADATASVSATETSGAAVSTGASISTVWVRVVNPTPMEVDVELVRSGGYGWRTTVAAGSDRMHVVPHAVLGSAPLYMKLVRWPSSRRLRTVYAPRATFRVGPGQVVVVRLDDDLTRSMVYLDAPENRGRHLEEADSLVNDRGAIR